MALHGHPRYTKALDVWIELSPQNAASVVAALDHFGFSSLGLQAADFLEPEQVIQLGYPPNRIDILTSPKGVDFETGYISGSSALPAETYLVAAAQAGELVQEVLMDPATVRSNYKDYIEYFAPDGRGLRFNSDGSFVGFINP